MRFCRIQTLAISAGGAVWPVRCQRGPRRGVVFAHLSPGFLRPPHRTCRPCQGHDCADQVGAAAARQQFFFVCVRVCVCGCGRGWGGRGGGGPQARGRCLLPPGLDHCRLARDWRALFDPPDPPLSRATSPQRRERGAAAHRGRPLLLALHQVCGCAPAPRQPATPLRIGSPAAAARRSAGALQAGG
jgi:hypothetical protein